MEKKVKTENCCYGFQLLLDEIIAEILSRLPIDSIMMCKCVCKAWNSLVNDNYFIRLHIAKSQSNTSASHIVFEALESKSKSRYKIMKRYLYNVENHKGIMIPVYPHVEDKTSTINMHMHITSSLHGLICISARYSYPVVIYNPLIPGDYVCLPETRTMRHRTFTLGFDHSGNKYKVVKILSGGGYEGSYILGCELFTIGKDTTWRQVDFPYSNLAMVYYRGVFHRGSVYWMIQDMSIGGCILEFDLSKEVFFVGSFPSSIRQPAYDNRHRIRLQSLGEHLNLTERKGRFVHVWRLSKQTNGSSEIVGHRTMKIKPPSMYATQRCDYTFLNNNENLLLLITHGGFEPETKERTPGTHFTFFRPSLKKKNRLTDLSDLPSTFTSANDVHAWCFQPSLVSIRRAMLN